MPITVRGVVKTKQEFEVQDYSLGTTHFALGEGDVRLTRLCGQDSGAGSGLQRILGMTLVVVDGHRHEGQDLTLELLEQSEHALNCHWIMAGGALRLVTRWRESEGITCRQDTISNVGQKPLTLTRCLTRFLLPRGTYECYTQSSRWCHENQGAWQILHTGLNLRHAWGRSTEDSTPYLALRTLYSECGLAFHILPRGNWMIRVTPVAEGGDLPHVVVELGLADENLHRVLLAGESLLLPEILIQALPKGLPQLAAPALHRFLLANHFSGAKREAPVVYNTWFDQFEILDVTRLRRQLTAAKATGCEVFVVDAGWYGNGDSDWSAQTGDWHEKTTTAFCGQMNLFADEVRAAGLGFGLWMEPERYGAKAPIRSEHPEWFVPVGSFARLDLSQPPAYTYLREEISRLVAFYGLAWMKLDFNFSMDDDESGAELLDYSSNLHRLLDDVRAAHPHTFFEGCSSGAMRGDLATLSHVDGHFLSDSVNPVDVLRISQGAWLRLPPGRITRWAVVRPAGRVVPRYASSVSDSPPSVLAPCGALWEPAMTVDLYFTLLAAMPGMFGLSGDLAELEEAHSALIAEAVAFFKSWRRFIINAVAHLLTPPESLEQRLGWVAVQLQAPNGGVSLVFAYRIGQCGIPPRLHMCGLDPATRYSVQCGFGTGRIECADADSIIQGLQLPMVGRLMALGHGAEVFTITPLS